VDEGRIRAGARKARYTVVKRDGSYETVDAPIIHEDLVSIYVNGLEVATVMCSPREQEAMALGFLANEGIINSLDEVAINRVCNSGGCVDVWLTHADTGSKRRLILTAGCGGGVTFDDLSESHPALPSDDVFVPVERLWALMDELYQHAELYSEARGVHTAAFSPGEHVTLAAEDIGRHNTLDKIRGKALQQRIDMRGGVLLTTGRVSSEMINKARSMGIPIVCSRTSPTSLSVRLAAEWNITLVGYLRRNSLNVYTHPRRVLATDAPPGELTAAPNGRTGREKPSHA
jgi:FdhD protein